MEASESPTQRSTVTERISALVGERILAGRIPPGAPLREEDLAQEFSASRHVIREVLRYLVSSHLAEYVPFRGARVRKLTESEVHDIYRARRVLEGGAFSAETVFDETQKLARLHADFIAAVERGAWQDAFRIDMAFHSSIVASIGSQHVSDWHSELLQDLKLAHLVAPTFQEEGFKASIEEHAEIALALAAHDAQRAKEALVRHLENSELLFTRQIAVRERSASPRRGRPPAGREPQALAG